MSRRRWLVLVVAVVAAALAGCTEEGEPVETVAPSEDQTPTTGALPSADELVAVLPEVDALPGSGWERDGGPAPAEAGDDEDDDQGPVPLCAPDGPGHPLSAVLFDRDAPGGAGVRFQDPDESTVLTIVLAPVDGASELIATARTDVEDCSVAAGATLEPLPWPAVGDASIALGREDEEPYDPDRQLLVTTTQRFVLAHVGDVVVAVHLQAITVPEDPGPLLTDEDVQAVVAEVADRLEGLR